MNINGGINNGGIAVIVFFDLLSGVARNSNEIIRLLGGGEISLSKRFY